MLNLESGDRIELFYEDSPEATIRATVNRLTKSEPAEKNRPFRPTRNLLFSSI